MYRLDGLPHLDHAERASVAVSTGSRPGSGVISCCMDQLLLFYQPGAPMDDMQLESYTCIIAKGVFCSSEASSGSS